MIGGNKIQTQTFSRCITVEDIKWIIFELWCYPIKLSMLLR